MAAFLLYSLAFLILYVLTKHFLHKIQNLPPSPFPCLPIIGHLYLLKNPILFRSLGKLSQKHGPVMFLQFGNRHVVVVSSQSAAEDCLTKNDIVFANRPQLMAGKIIGNNFRNLIGSPYGDNWRNIRRIASIEVFSNTRLKILSSLRANEVKLLMRNLLKFHQDDVIDMRTVFFEFMLNMLTRIIIGKRYYGENVTDEEEARRFRACLQEISRVVSTTNIGDFLPWLKSKKLEQKMIQCKKNRDELFGKLLQKAKESINNDCIKQRNTTVIEQLLSRQKSEPEFYTDEMIANFIFTMLTAGTESTVAAMEWMISLLLNNPEVLQKAENEISNVVGTDRLMEETDIPNLHYLRCVVSEVLRMYPSAPLLIPHESREDCTVGGYRIPAGTILLVNVWAIQNDPKIWADPGKFKPERFEGMEGMGKDGFKLMPFGSGRRACPGDNLALRVIGLTMGSLIQCFEWRRVGKEMVDLTERRGLTYAKVLPLEAKCRPRAAMMKLLR